MDVAFPEACALDEFLGALFARTGYDYRAYARTALRRRLARHLAAEQLGNLSELRDLVSGDAEALDRLTLALAPPQQPLFRRPAFFATLRQEIFPVLRTYPSLTVWHPACGTGEGVYATAMLLAEAGLYARARIYATDASESALAAARRGVYPQEAVAAHAGNVGPPGQSSLADPRWIADDGVVRMHEELRERIVFAEHHLGTDASFNEFHLIVCRDVMLDFQPALQARVLHLLHESLCPFGFLVIGHGESLRHHPRAECYDPLPDAEGFFRKVRK